MELTLKPGDVVAGEFRIERQLSEGGMGTLYVALQIRTGKRRALKVMHSQEGPGAESKRRRFEQEARVGALIASEHVVDVIAAGVDAATGAPWLVMELLQGEDLSQYLARHGPLPASEVRDIFRQIFHALAAAHDIPVVHRDLKPENIFLAKPLLADAPFLVKVLDFGIAKVLTDGMSTTAAVGTPLWMAPEQTDVRGGVRPATDVWALGLLAFRLLSGVCYWRSAEAGDTNTLLREILVDPLDSASTRARELRGGELPPGFDAWFERCVTRAASERYPHARAAWSDLAPLLGRDAMPSLNSEGGRFRIGADPASVSEFGATEQLRKTAVDAVLLPTEASARQSTQDGAAMVSVEALIEARSRLRPIFLSLGAVIVLGAVVAVTAVIESGPSRARTGAPPLASDIVPAAMDFDGHAPMAATSVFGQGAAPAPSPSADPLAAVASGATPGASSSARRTGGARRPPASANAAPPMGVPSRAPDAPPAAKPKVPDFL